MNILILCTGNSARSILAEALINELAPGHLRAYSAGSQPAGTVNPGAIAKLERAGHSTEGLESKSWDRFSGPDAPTLDLVITVCDNAANESCPVWIGEPVQVHWGIPDPAAAPEASRELAFDQAYDRLRRRIEPMLELPLSEMGQTDLKDRLMAIHSEALVADTADR